jgi:protein-S-isoprenylcysteine O-methyltransferase Ste14
MDPRWAKAVVVLASVAMVAIRAPHGRRSRTVRVVKSRRGPREAALLVLAWAGFFLPLLWVVSPLLALAEYSLHPVAFLAGLLALALGLWVFHRSHADLGANWSITLEVRENHSLVTEGVYRRVRHPMYLALLLYGLGQALVLPNWIAGPFYVASLALLVALRLGPEEAMMRERFASEYDAYQARTRRLVPGIW